MLNDDELQMNFANDPRWLVYFQVIFCNNHRHPPLITTASSDSWHIPGIIGYWICASLVLPPSIPRIEMMILYLVDNLHNHNLGHTEIRVPKTIACQQVIVSRPLGREECWLVLTWSPPVDRGKETLKRENGESCKTTLGHDIENIVWMIRGR